MRRIVLGLFMAVAVLAVAATVAQAQPCPGTVAQIDPANIPGTGPAPGSTLQADANGFVTFTWCNASADYFLIIETVQGDHDIFFAFTGGAGGGAGQNFLTLPIVPSLPNALCAATPPVGCIPAKGETIFFTLDTVKNKQILGSVQYTFTAPGTPPPPQQVATTTTVDPKTATASAADQTVTLTATVAAASTVNQGTVTFQLVDAAAKNVGAAVTSAALTTGSASVNYLLPGGTAAQDLTIQAKYSGGTNFQASSGSATLTVNVAPSIKEPTTTAVSDQGVTFSAAAQNVTLTATVTAASPVNEGTVTFQVVDGASVNVGTAVTSATLTSGNASAIYALPAGLAAAPYTIQATYSGGANFLTSSGSGTLTVSQLPPPNQVVTVTIASNSTATFSSDIQHVTLTAAVSAPGATVNEGTVTFQVMDGVVNIGSAVPSAPLTTGLASVSYALPAGLPVKDYTIQAGYSGGTNFSPSSDVATLSITKAPSTTTFTSTAPPSLPVGGTYTPTATSTGDGTLTIGASGACSIAGGVVTATSPGTCTVTATESEGANFLGSSATPQSITVTAPAPTISSLMAQVESLNLNKGNKQSLMSKLQAAQASVDRGNGRAAANQLGAFINEVMALQHSRRLDAKTAASLIAQAQSIIGSLDGKLGHG
jgi:Big-like domain-containing protein/FIMAH domain-containing protein